MVGTELYQGILAHDYGDQETTELNKKVWEPTPWVVDAYTGGWGKDRDREDRIRKWCLENIGPESSPIHDTPGVWHRGGATINGWTYMGFATEEMMNQFQEAWPAPAGVEELRGG